MLKTFGIVTVHTHTTKARARTHTRAHTRTHHTRAHVRKNAHTGTHTPHTHRTRTQTHYTHTHTQFAVSVRNLRCAHRAQICVFIVHSAITERCWPLEQCSVCIGSEAKVCFCVTGTEYLNVT